MYDRESLTERVARTIDPKSHAELDADFAKTKSITWEKMYAMPGVRLSREKAEKVIQMVQAQYSPYVVFDERTFKVFVVSNSGKTVQEYECSSLSETLNLAAKFRSQIELKETD